MTETQFSAPAPWCLVLSGILIGLVLAGQGVASPGQGASSDFSRDRFLLGSWSCEAHRPDGANGREDATYRLTLDGRWLYLEYTYKPATGPRHSVHAYESYDSSRRKWVYSSFSSDGSFGQSLSNGWNGNTKVYGPAPGDSPFFKLTVTKTSGTAFTERVETQANDGRIVERSRLTCKKKYDSR